MKTGLGRAMGAGGMTLALIVVVVAVATLPVGDVVMAQAELTLQSLSERLDEMGAELATLSRRVEIMTAAFDGPGAQDLGDGECAIGAPGYIQNATVLKYHEAFGEWPGLDRIAVAKVVYSEDSDRIGIQYKSQWPERFVTEWWNGCEFEASSAWQEE